MDNHNNAANLNCTVNGDTDADGNNRYIAVCVRGVLALCNFMKLTKEKLLLDLYSAFYKARKGKTKRRYVQAFERNLYENLTELRDELWDRTYKPSQSFCFIVNIPKKREVFASLFRDRIVHHLYFDYTHEIYERTFIADTYSCVKGRGTHYGIERFRHHILSESQNYTKPCYVLKIDIRGYFMNIDRNVLLQIASRTLEKYKTRHKDKNTKWDECIDFDFIVYLTREIILYDPTTNCRYISPKEEYKGLSRSKMLAYSPKDCGLPIGNLTSQLLSNVYMNVFDNFMKRNLKCKHYGRYVDDAYIVSTDREKLRTLIPQIKSFLYDNLHLEMQEGKTTINNVLYGVEFLGAFLKPHRTYISSQSLKRIKANSPNTTNKEHFLMSMSSKISIMSHYKSYNQKLQFVNNLLFSN